ncbi:MAG: 50S ribosomal protein L33 [Planctomycetota bacterium]
MAREWILLECPDCGNRNYRTERRGGPQTAKLELSKYCFSCRKHSVHKEKKK